MCFTNYLLTKFFILINCFTSIEYIKICTNKVISYINIYIYILMLIRNLNRHIPYHYENNKIKCLQFQMSLLVSSMFWNILSCKKIIQFKSKENRKTIMRVLIIYWFMCMHWLKHVRLNRKDQLKNMCSTTLEVAMLADVSEALNAISNVYPCVTGPSEPSSFPLDVLDSDWSTKC